MDDEGIDAIDWLSCEVFSGLVATLPVFKVFQCMHVGPQGGPRTEPYHQI